MASLCTITTPSSTTTANKIALHKTLTSINNTAGGSVSFLPLRRSSTSKSLSRRSSSVSGRVFPVTRSEADTMSTIEKSGIKITKNPPESMLADLGVRSWPKWGCDPSKFPWTYSSKETCFLLKGKVKVYPDGSDDEAVEIVAGDMVEFPKGMSCTWDVSETVDKHYKFE